MKGNSGNVMYMVKNFFASSSDEEDNNTKEAEEFDSPDYEPFMALFRRFRKEQSAEEVKKYMEKGLCNIRENPIIMEIVLKLFDFETDIEDIEKDVLFVKEKLEIIFNFIDVSFQFMTGTMDKHLATLLMKMNELRKYYDRKSTLNCSHNEIIIDLFRTCVRKDTVLFAGLESNFEGYLDKSDGTSMDVVDIATMVNPSTDISGQSNIERLCNFKVLTSQFEARFDGLNGDYIDIANEFVDWESAGEIFSFEELRNALCGEAKLCFDADHLYLFGLAYTEKDSKKIWTTRTINLEGIEYKKHPGSLDEL